jgi:hypothetical protein
MILKLLKLQNNKTAFLETNKMNKNLYKSTFPKENKTYEKYRFFKEKGWTLVEKRKIK